MAAILRASGAIPTTPPVREWLKITELKQSNLRTLHIKNSSQGWHEPTVVSTYIVSRGRIMKA